MVVLDETTLEQVYITADMAIDAPSQDVWSIVGAFGEPTLGKGFVTKVELEGEGVGAVRTLYLTNDVVGDVVRERQTGRDERGMYYAFELIDTGGIPFTDYYACAHVVPVDENSCRLLWLNRYRAAPAAVADMKAQSHKLLQLVERNLKEALKGRT
ncbi:SRPBCC family protein [Hyphococcus sp.]|uniref:SRPBCC family protein n=1 Tax=Hyphococcus sp. TaxID=2038636 RepID=UPI003CCB8A9A